MKFDHTITLAQRTIIQLLEKSPTPMTKRELSVEMNVTYQTVTNHFTPLLMRGLVKEAYKRGNAMTYVLGDEIDSMPRMIWRNESKPIVQVVRETLLSGDFPTNIYSAAILTDIAQLYKLSAQAVDNNEPKSIPVAQLKHIQVLLYQRKQTLEALLKTINSMLDNSSLWDPRELVQVLILNDPEMSLEIARSIWERSEEMKARIEK